MAILWILRAEDMVEERALVEVEVLDIGRIHGPQLSRELQHVVSVTMLCGVFGQVSRYRIWLAEVLSLRVGSDSVGMSIDGDLPSIASDVPLTLVFYGK